MLASPAFFVVKAMVSPADGASPAAMASVPAGPADDDSAPRVTRAHGSKPSVLKRVLAVVHHGTGGGTGTSHRGNRRLGRLARAD
jgi:hypothetical protein